MHPILNSRLLLTLYGAAWALGGGLLGALLVIARPGPWGEALAFSVPMALVLGALCLSSWFVCRAAPVGSAPPARVAGTQAVAAVVAGIVWALSGAGWAAALRGLGVEALPFGSLPWDLTLMLAAGAVLFVVSAIAHYLILAVEASRTAERRALEMQVHAREAELKALRAQINPHFLFNSLNTISSLASSSPEASRRACLLLADFLRRSLQLGAREAIPLSEELSLARGYLEIERVRFGERLGLDVRVEEVAARCRVPPLILQPLTENAIVHGIAHRVEGGVIRIEGRVVNGRLYLAVENPRDVPAPAGRGQGVGLANVRARLEALDPRQTRLDVRQGSGTFRVELVLPLRLDEPVPAQAREAAAGPAGGGAAGPEGDDAR